jgi:hypothetical protein
VQIAFAAVKVIDEPGVGLEKVNDSLKLAGVVCPFTKLNSASVLRTPFWLV